jgi:hypothetical protein
MIRRYGLTEEERREKRRISRRGTKKEVGEEGWSSHHCVGDT